MTDLLECSKFLGGIITFHHINNTIKALVFDFDGLILDTEEPEFLAWQAVYQSYGTQLEVDEWLACVGTSPDVFDPIQNLQTRASVPIDIRRVQTERKKYFKQFMQALIPLPGVMDYLVDAKRLGLNLAIASSSPAQWVNYYLQQLNIKSSFDSICVAEDVANVKPDPALYNCAIQRLGVKPCETVAFEDSLNGLLAAKGAGLYCVAVPNGITRNLDFSLADRVLNSLADVPLSDLLTNFNGCDSD